jgi:hypothetical protein
MAQFGRPTTDTTRTNWEEDDGGTTAIFDQIDESVADDADYIRTGLAPSNAIFVTKLSALEDPVSSSNHVVRYRYGKDASGGAQINITVQLRQGYVSEGTPGTLIAAQTHTDAGAFPQAGSFTLTGGEADSITDYADLYLRFVASQV